MKTEPVKRAQQGLPLFDWKSCVIGGGVVLLTSVAAVSGIHASRYAIDCNQSEAVIMIDRQINQQRAMMNSKSEADRYLKAEEQSEESDQKTDKEQEILQTTVTKEDASVSSTELTKTAEDVSEEPDSVSSNETPAVTESGWYEAYPEIQRGEDGSLFYVIVSGDTLLGISDKFGFGVTELASYNQISNPSRIYIGERILFPEQGPSFIGDPSVGLG